MPTLLSNNAGLSQRSLERRVLLLDMYHLLQHTLESFFVTPDLCFQVGVSGLRLLALFLQHDTAVLRCLALVLL